MPPSEQPSENLFKPYTLGTLTLSHRVVLAPLTRCKSTLKTHIPILPMTATYYSQRGSVPGSLLIAGATSIAPQACVMANTPGIWSDEQVEAWSEVVSAVHAQKSFIFSQLWAAGRTARPSVINDPSNPFLSPGESIPYLAPSATPVASLTKTHPTHIPEPMSLSDISRFIAYFVDAAKKVVHGAGFDGVEVHAANGYLVDQFLQTSSNLRTEEDGYGGSIEERCRFALEIVQGIANAIGEERVGIRISPWSQFQDMGMDDPIPTYTYLVKTLKKRFPNLAYIHVIEPEVHGAEVASPNPDRVESNDFIREIWAPKTIISAGNYTRNKALERTKKCANELVAFGKFYISNPDLPARLMKGAPLTPFNKNTFYTPGEDPNAAVGYIDYPFMDSEEQRKTD